MSECIGPVGWFVSQWWFHVSSGNFVSWLKVFSNNSSCMAIKYLSALGYPLTRSLLWRWGSSLEHISCEGDGFLSLGFVLTLQLYMLNLDLAMWTGFWRFESGLNIFLEVWWHSMMPFCSFLWMDGSLNRVSQEFFIITSRRQGLVLAMLSIIVLILLTALHDLLSLTTCITVNQNGLFFHLTETICCRFLLQKAKRALVKT